MAINSQTMNSGMSSGNMNGNMISAMTRPASTNRPTTTTPMPANTNTRTMAAQKAATIAAAMPPTPTTPFIGPVTGCPSITIDTLSP